MPNIGNFLFGSERKAETQKTKRLTPEQLAFMRTILGKATSQMGEGLPEYEGELTADASDLQTSLFNILSQQTDGISGQMETGRERLAGAQPGQVDMPALEQFTKQIPEAPQVPQLPEAPSLPQMPGVPDYQQFDPDMPAAPELPEFEKPEFERPDYGEMDQGPARQYWEQSIVEPARQEFRQETLPELREQFAGQGALSSSGFNRAVADAAANMNTQLGAKLGDIMQQERQAYLDRELQRESQELKQQIQKGQMGLQRQGQMAEQALQEQSQLGNLATQLAGLETEQAGTMGELGLRQQGQIAGQQLERGGMQLQRQGQLADQLLSAAGMAPQYAGLELEREGQEADVGLSTIDSALAELDAIMRGGEQQRGIEQQGLEAQFQEWQRTQPYNNPWLQQGTQMMNVSPYQIDTIAKGGGTGALGGMMKGIGQGLGSMMAG